jgi:cation:H+ antiporter
VLSILAGLVLLVVGGDRLVAAAVSIAVRYRVPPAIIGATIVAAGTSMPELVVSVSAALDGAPDVSLGNIVGSNLYNVGLIMGLAALVSPLRVSEPTARQEFPLLILVSLVLWAMLMDGTLGRIDAGLLFAGQIGLLVWMVRRARADGGSGEAATPTMSPMRSAVELVVSILVLVAGGKLLINGGVTMAEALGVSQRVIGLTVVAVGTSLPELAASVMAAWRGEDDIAVGNVVGSNLFNILFILGVTGLIQPLTANPAMTTLDVPVMVVFQLLGMAVCLTGRRVTRAEGGVLIASAAGYTAWLF